jgi:hypothetical protein
MFDDPVRVDPVDKSSLEASGYDFSVYERDGGGAVMQATPKEYTKRGRVSFYLELDPELLENQLELCFTILDGVRGNDKRGKPAGKGDPLFVPDPYLDVRFPGCL